MTTGDSKSVQTANAVCPIKSQLLQLRAAELGPGILFEIPSPIPVLAPMLRHPVFLPLCAGSYTHSVRQPPSSSGIRSNCAHVGNSTGGWSRPRRHLAHHQHPAGRVSRA